MLERLKASLADRYRVEREIGQGGMATVYLATDLKHDRSVAIKVLLPDLARSVGHERFLREIEIAAKLQHPHILPVYDSGEADGLLYYVMPYVAGESLRDRIRRESALPREDAIQITREVAGALDYAHSEGIIHRDIKPANILLSQGHAQVADFGIARALTASAGAGLTQVGMAIGTPEYMSPEQALGGTDLDGRADVYAVGCVLYEMLSGRPPFQGKTPQSVLAQSISGSIPKLEKDASGVQGVIDRAMAKEPSDRFQTAGTLDEALRTPTGPIAVRRSSRRWMGGVAAAIVVLVVAAVGFWPRGWRVDGDPRKSLVIFPFENKTGDANRDYLQEASMNLLGLVVAHWEDIRVYDDERTGSLLRRRGVENPSEIDFDAAQDMAKEARAGTLVLGDIRREGDSLAIEAKVHDTRSGERLATEIVRAELSSDPRPLFDSLAARILHVSGAPPGERPELIAQTTRSLEAYRSYLAGVGFLQQFNIDSSRASFTRAIELDSTFALAYIGLRNVSGWAGAEGSDQQRRESVAKAQAFSATLPPRLRTLVQYYVAYEDGEMARARRLAEQLILRDSSDIEAWYQLGEAHFHDRPRQVPRPDSAGNLGTALRAFERTLALDPRYTLAYQHTLDALGNCGANAPWLCLADSAVYGTASELADRYGVDRVRQIREGAQEAQVATAQAWIDAVPRSTRPRLVLLPILMERDRLTEARSQIAALRAGGELEGARIWNARLLFREARYAEAAESLAVVLKEMTNATAFFLRDSRDGPQPVFDILAGGGRPTQLVEFLDQLLTVIAGVTDVANGPGGVPLPIPLLDQQLRMSIAASFGLDRQDIQRLSSEWLDTVDSMLIADSLLGRRVHSGSGSAILTSYLGSRDTTILARFLEVVDTTGSRTWRAMDAHLGLARGDTARAQVRIDQQVRNADDLEFSGEPGTVRVFAWADLLAQVGSFREALDVFGHIDSIQSRSRVPSLHVRSFAERGALYQQLGDADQAVDMYERFIAAWEGGDEVVQPLVTRARNTVAALRGGVETGERR